MLVYIRMIIRETVMRSNRGSYALVMVLIFIQKRLSDCFREHLGQRVLRPFLFLRVLQPMYLALSAVTRSWNSVITASTAHLEQDECGAPEKFLGCKVLTVDTPDGKINNRLIEKHLHGFDFEHHSQPKVISITQSTEMGTVYTLAEIREIADFAHSNGHAASHGRSQDIECCCFTGSSFQSFHN